MYFLRIIENKMENKMSAQSNAMQVFKILFSIFHYLARPKKCILVVITVPHSKLTAYVKKD